MSKNYLTQKNFAGQADPSGRKQKTAPRHRRPESGFKWKMEIIRPDDPAGRGKRKFTKNGKRRAQTGPFCLRTVQDKHARRRESGATTNETAYTPK
ncbi:MAG: hypothetical protein DYG98_09320 [Haliscomenobacteraceae bacterium CHB4]|nr:hypothetical protein [Haliscomenobacteraceae bacterium CHB4]